MCESCGSPPAGPTRRHVLVGAAAGALVLGSGRTAAPVATAPVVSTAGGPAIHPRAAWSGGLEPTGPLDVEAPGDVRFLLVHHTAGSNDYGPGDVPTILQGIYRFHTGPDKRWPDVAYNFFVDRHGGVWEGRAGSLAAPVKGDATGGSQGFAQLCCFIGTHTDTPPTIEAQAAMVALLAWLASTYGIDTAPGTTASFVSRGSSNHPPGSSVTTSTIAGHRDMSATTCPGDAAYALVTGSFAAAVTAQRAPALAPSPDLLVAPEPTRPPTTPIAPGPEASTTTTPLPTSSVGPSSTPTPTPTTPSSVGAGEEAGAARSEGDGSPVGPVVAGGVLVAGALAGGLVALRRRRSGSGPSDPAS